MVDKPGERDQQQIEAENQLASDLGQEDPISSRQPAADPIEPGADPDAPPPPPKPNRSDRFADKRKDIFKNFRENRAAIEETPLAEQIAATRETRFDPQTQQPALKAEQQPPAQQQQQPAAPAPKRKLKVLGQELELTDEEIIANASRALAAGSILDNAKRDATAMRAEAMTLLETAKRAQDNPPAPQQPSAPARQPAQPAAILADRDELAEIADKIQVGNQEEALAALQKYGEVVARRAAEQVTSQLDDRIAAQVEGISVNTERSRNMEQTLGSFFEKAPEYQDEAMGAALTVQSVRQMRAKMTVAGIEDAWIDEVTRGLVHRSDGSPLTPQEKITAAYNRAISEGHTLPSHGEILREADAEILKKNGRPARVWSNPPPTPENQNRFDPTQRLERKREIAPQPRRAGALPNSEQQQRTREQSQRDAVSQMRAYRGRRS